MYPQCKGKWGCVFTVVAFMQLFSTVHFNMLPQSACIRGNKVTLVPFVWLFFTVYFQIIPQITCIRGSKVTLVAFVWLFPTMAWVFICVLKWPAWVAYSHWLHLCNFFYCIFLLFSSMRFQMYPQITCTKRGIVALAAFFAFRYSYILRSYFGCMLWWWWCYGGLSYS